MSDNLPDLLELNNTDPVADDHFPHIREYRPDEDDVEWPEAETQLVTEIEDMLATTAAVGWGSGWPDCNPAKRDLATVEVNDASGRVVARFPIRKRLARLLDIILDYCARRGYVFTANQCGAYNCRKIAGTNTTSNHARATAIDINWGRNPHKRPLTTDIPGWMVDLLERYLWRWGGRWSKPDAMHFEFAGTPVDADRMLDKAIRELLDGKLPPVGRPTLKKGSEGPAVAEVQRMLNIKVDGFFGKDTEDAVKRFQSAHGLDSDGEVGPKTWARLDQEANDMNGDQDRLLKEMHSMSAELHKALVQWSIRSRVDDKDYNSQIFLSAIHGDLWEKFKTLDARLDRIEAAIKDPKVR
jgi:hypothetical protein